MAIGSTEFVAFLAFLGGFLGIFALNLAVTDLFYRERELLRRRMEAEKRERLRQRVRQAASEGGDRLSKLAHEASLQTAQPKTPLARLNEVIEQAGLELALGWLLAICAAVGLLVAAVTSVLSEHVILGALSGGVASFAPLLYVQFKRQQRLDALRSQLPDALDLMSRVLRAGQTISQAMHAVSTEFKPPVGAEFGYCYDQQNLGLDAELTLRELARRTGLLEIKIFVLALLVHRRAGGNLTELLDNLAAIVRERFRIRGRVKALTAEGRLQAVALLAAPPAVFALLLIINREYVIKLLDHPVLLIVSLISMVLGAIWIHRIVNFDF